MIKHEIEDGSIDPSLDMLSILPDKLSSSDKKI